MRATCTLAVVLQGVNALRPFLHPSITLGGFGAVYMVLPLAGKAMARNPKQLQLAGKDIVRDPLRLPLAGKEIVWNAWEL